MFPTLFVILALAVMYWFPVRRWMARWGTTPSDLTRVMAGDGLIVDPTYSGTMAIIVNARPEHIWPWLVPPAYSPSFNTWPPVTRFPLGEARRGRFGRLNPVVRSCWT